MTIKNPISNRPSAFHQGLKVFSLSLFLFLITGCIKDDDLVDQLPKATQTGENTFSCLLNDEVWIANDALGAQKILSRYDESGEYIYGNHYFSIRSLRSTNWGVQSERLNITIEPVISEGVFNINDLKTLEVKYEIDKNIVEPDSIRRFYELNTNAPIKIEFYNIDTVNNVCSGTFEFELQNLEDSLDIISVTDGRFDAPYTPL